MAPAGRYLLAVLGGAVAAFATFCTFYGSLYLAGILPPPPLSNSVCVDEKLVFLRNSPQIDPNFLVVGSSVAWRSFDSRVIVERNPHVRPLNGGFCGMQIHHSAFLTQWMTDRWPSIDSVLLMASPLDFNSCTGSGQVFDPADANRFVFERRPSWSFYLRYFDPVSLLRNIKRQSMDRAEARAMGFAMEFTPYGDGPLDTTKNRGLFYRQISGLDQACFDALRTFATKLSKEGRRFMVVTTPLHPGWTAKYDPDGSMRRHISQGIRHALDGTGARFWNAAEESGLDVDAFTDAIHIRWSAATPFTQQIVARLLTPFG
jgi:hypothetical protein